MTRNDILRLAREADMIDFRDDDSDPHVKQMIDFFEVVIARAVAAEREACAGIALINGKDAPTKYEQDMAAAIAAAIRARGAL